MIVLLAAADRHLHQVEAGPASARTPFTCGLAAPGASGGS